jgi:hypothetical protein
MISISTSWMYQQQVSTMLSQQDALSQTENEVSTGNAINVPSDNPIGAAQIVGLNHILAENTEYTNNITSANTRLSTKVEHAQQRQQSAQQRERSGFECDQRRVVEQRPQQHGDRADAIPQSARAVFQHHRRQRQRFSPAPVPPPRLS